MKLLISVVSTLLVLLISQSEVYSQNPTFPDHLPWPVDVPTLPNNQVTFQGGGFPNDQCVIDWIVPNQKHIQYQMIWGQTSSVGTSTAVFKCFRSERRWSQVANGFYLYRSDGVFSMKRDNWSTPSLLLLTDTCLVRESIVSDVTDPLTGVAQPVNASEQEGFVRVPSGLQYPLTGLMQSHRLIKPARSNAYANASDVSASIHFEDTQNSWECKRALKIEGQVLTLLDQDNWPAPDGSGSDWIDTPQYWADTYHLAAVSYIPDFVMFDWSAISHNCNLLYWTGMLQFSMAPNWPAYVTGAIYPS